MIRDYDIESLLEALSSKDPVPGGGGASALAGALGVSLGAMVISLTLGKKRYADVEEDLQRDQADFDMFREMFLRLSEKDEEAFLPLSRAYSLPKETEDQRKIRDVVMEQALFDAALVPLSVMETVEGALPVLKDVAKKGSRLAISDAGVGAAYLRTALTGARYNVLINVRSMKNEERRTQLMNRCERALRNGTRLADETEQIVAERI